MARFTVKWIAGTHDARIEARIRGHIENRGYEPVIERYRTTREFVDTLQHDRTDILVVSHKVVDPARFAQTLQRTTRRYPFDVLYYGISKSAITKSTLSMHSTVHVIAGTQFLDTLLEMINENPAKWKKPRFIRGMLISRSVDLESAINECIINRLALPRHLNPQTKSRCEEIMYDYAHSLRSKTRTLEMIMTIDGKVDKNLIKLIDDVAQIRNRLAHVSLDTDDLGTVTSTHDAHKGKSKYTFDKNRMWKTLQRIDDAIIRINSMTN